jgi:hypothetical protein
MSTHTEHDIPILASGLRAPIADAEVDGGVLTNAGADHIAAVLSRLPSSVRREVFHILDTKPGRWDYKDSKGREYHYKLRQFRNYHRDKFVACLNG